MTYDRMVVMGGPRPNTVRYIYIRYVVYNYQPMVIVAYAHDLASMYRWLICRYCLAQCILASKLAILAPSPTLRS